MKEFIKDLEVFFRKHWKPIIFIIGILFIVSNYSDLKSGIIDGWLNK